MVSQTNPHVLPFLRDEAEDARSALAGNSHARKVSLGSYLHSLESTIRADVSSRTAYLVRLGLLPRMFGSEVAAQVRRSTRGISLVLLVLPPYPQFSGLLLQKYTGDVTILARQAPGSQWRALSQPSAADMRNYILEGARATWPHIAHIRALVCVERTLAQCTRRCLHEAAALQGIERSLATNVQEDEGVSGVPLLAMRSDEHASYDFNRDTPLTEARRWGDGMAPTANPIQRVTSYAYPSPTALAAAGPALGAWSAVPSPLTSIDKHPSLKGCSTGGTGTAQVEDPVDDEGDTVPALRTVLRHRSQGAPTSVTEQAHAGQHLTLGARLPGGTPLGGYWARSRETMVINGSSPPEAGGSYAEPSSSSSRRFTSGYVSEPLAVGRLSTRSGRGSRPPVAFSAQGLPMSNTSESLAHQRQGHPQQGHPTDALHRLPQLSSAALDALAEQEPDAVSRSNSYLGQLFPPGATGALQSEEGGSSRQAVWAWSVPYVSNHSGSNMHTSESTHQWLHVNSNGGTPLALSLHPSSGGASPTCGIFTLGSPASSRGAVGIALAESGEADHRGASAGLRLSPGGGSLGDSASFIGSDERPTDESLLTPAREALGNTVGVMDTSTAATE